MAISGVDALVYDQRCLKGDNAWCATLGERFQFGRGVQADVRLAAFYNARACRAGVQGGCIGQAIALFEGQGVPRDEEKGFAMFAKICRQDPKPCSEFGNLYGVGLGLPKAPLRATRLLKMGCEGKDADACHDLGVMLRGMNGIPRDAKRALGYLALACRLGHKRGCELGSDLALEARSSEQDPRMINDLLTRGCDGMSSVCCFNLAVQYARGNGVRRDDARARALFSRACELGNEPACKFGRRQP